MTVANFAEPRFAGLLNSMAPTAYFFGNVQQIPLWRRISHKSDCPHSRLAAVSCFDWYRVSCLRPVAACISCATSVVSSAALRLVGRHLPTLGLASSIHAVPGSLARLISREAAGGDRAHRGDGRARPHREGCCAARVLCRVRGAREERPLWIWFLPPCWGPLNNICVCRDKIYLRP